MKSQSIILRKFWGIYFWFVFGGSLILLFPLFWLLLRSEKTYPAANRLRKVWGNIIMAFTGVYYQVEFESPIDPNQPVILCANHSSILDIPFFAFILPAKFCFMAKKEFAEIPIFGHFFKTVDIPVDRENRMSSFKAFKATQKRLEEGYNVIIFPEGRANPSPPEMLPFKNGPFKMAIECKVPIVPITFIDNWHRFLFHAETFGGSPGVLRVKVHAPVYTQNMEASDYNILLKEVRQKIETPLIETYGSQQGINTEYSHFSKA
ncbi:MAG: lysophospholipid acyltransferase family protein [Chitinophagales bacterium]